MVKHKLLVRPFAIAQGDSKRTAEHHSLTPFRTQGKLREKSLIADYENRI
ncbi:hypothetical protein A45J_0765 [hot springs metagenome]|uniref:Uncharacterized protein n=1 Tax=hot springs metagenome TaxID=433727 RepID=A0A5J4KV18_9ZZZZ